VDEREFDALYERSARRLVGVAYAACGDLQEAQDCVQEAFVRAWARRHLLDVAGAPEAWVRVTALRLAVSRWRRMRGLDRALARSGPPPAPAEPDGLRLDLQRAMRTLPPRTRVAVTLHYLCDLPVDEIARQTRTPVNTVKSQLSRGRAALRALLTPAETQQEPDRA
jgi:RNA polymerase sigma-70 factor (ECF subfamily)